MADLAAAEGFVHQTLALCSKEPQGLLRSGDDKQMTFIVIGFMVSIMNTSTVPSLSVSWGWALLTVYFMVLS